MELSNLLKNIKAEFSGFGKYERVIFPLVLVIVLAISLIVKDSVIAIIAALCGISYTILAGKGRVSCYYIGIAGTLCYSYLSFINGFYGNLALYALYYFPMEIIGIFQWSKNLKDDAREIKKITLTNKERFIYGISSFVIASILTVILYYAGDKNPIPDAFSTVLSVLGLFLAVKRCFEQWPAWIIVNVLTFIMWLLAYLDGAKCLSTVLMWFVYICLAVYFFYTWQKEVKMQ